MLEGHELCYLESLQKTQCPTVLADKVMPALLLARGIANDYFITE